MVLAKLTNALAELTKADRDRGGGMDKEYLTTEEVAELCRTTPSTVRYWRFIGYGPGALAIRVGRRVLYPADDVRKWLLSLKVSN